MKHLHPWTFSHNLLLIIYLNHPQNYKFKGVLIKHSITEIETLLKFRFATYDPQKFQSHIYNKREQT